MTIQRITLILFVAAAIWLGWKLLHPVHTYRFRLTVEVDKKGSRHSGSSVIELRTRRNYFLSMLPEVPDWETSVHGEAVFVDLGADGHLIALLPGTNDTGAIASLPSRAVLGDKKALAGPSGVLDTLSTLHPRELRASYGRSYRLTAEQLPPFIRFKDIDDPKSVERVGPEDLTVTTRLEVTHEQISRTIVRHLPWLTRFKPDKNLSGGNGSTWNAGEQPYSTPNQISFSAFIAGN